MKKLMIAAAIVCAAVVSQGAVTKWAWNTGSSTLKDGYTGKAAANLSPMANTTMYLLWYDGATGTGDKALQTSVLEGLRAGTYDLAANAVATATTDANGQLIQANAKAFTMDENLGTSAFFVEVVKTTYDGKDWYYFSATAKGTTPTSDQMTSPIVTTSGASTQLRDATGSAAYASPGWYAAAVPEPTSGLLLLLGVAGLALRRRRA